MGLNNLQRKTQLHTIQPSCTKFQGQLREQTLEDHLFP